jgi:hypothetical protein
MSLSDLANWRGASSRTASPAIETERNVVQHQTVNANIRFVPPPAVPEQPHVDVEHLTVNDVRDLSTAKINTLIPHRPDLVAQLIVDAGRRRRGELPMNTFAMRPISRCILLSGMKRRSEPLSDADEEYLAAYLDEIGAT